MNSEILKNSDLLNVFNNIQILIIMQCKGPIYYAKIAQIQPDYRFFAESRHI